MGKLVGIIGILVGLWIAAEVYTEGFDRAFGGIFSTAEDPGAMGVLDADVPSQNARVGSVPQRAGARVKRDFEEGAARYDKLLGE